MRPWTRLLFCLTVSALLHAPLLLVHKSSGSVKDRRSIPIPVELIDPRQSDLFLHSRLFQNESGTELSAFSELTNSGNPVRALGRRESNGSLEKNSDREDIKGPEKRGQQFSSDPAILTASPPGILSLLPGNSFLPNPSAMRIQPPTPDGPPAKEDFSRFSQGMQGIEGDLTPYTDTNSKLSFALQDEYLLRIKREVERNWQGRSGGGAKEGTTVLLVVLDAEGLLRSLDLHRSSGIVLRDVEAMEAVKRSLPFKPPPAHLLNKKGRLLIRFSFRCPFRPPS